MQQERLAPGVKARTAINIHSGRTSPQSLCPSAENIAGVLAQHGWGAHCAVQRELQRERRRFVGLCLVLPNRQNTQECKWKDMPREWKYHNKRLCVLKIRLGARGGGWRLSQQKQENESMQRTWLHLWLDCLYLLLNGQWFQSLFSFHLTFLYFNFSLPLSCFLFTSIAPASACLPHPLPLSIFTKQVKGPTCYLLSALSSPVCVPGPFSHPVSVSSVQIRSLLGHLLFCLCRGYTTGCLFQKILGHSQDSHDTPESWSQLWWCLLGMLSYEWLFCTYRDVKASACCRG